MRCPYCSADAVKFATNGELYVVEDISDSSELFDADVSGFRCVDDRTHVFYCDDGAGNGNDGYPDAE